MKLCLKRVYCTACCRLVRGRDHRAQGDTNRVEIICCRCGKLLHAGNGLTWKYVRDST